MIQTTPTKVLLTTTLAPLVRQLSGSLARGVRLIDRFLHAERTPQKTMPFARELSALWRDVGRRILAWVLHRLAPANDAEAPARIQFAGRLPRRRRRHPRSVATLFGSVTLWRRLYEPLQHGRNAIHPLALRWGIEAGFAPPALAERGGRWATDHTPQQVREMVNQDPGGPWSCTFLRTLRGRLRTGMAPHRHASPVDHVVRWLEQARVASGHFRPPLAVGRDGIYVPLRHGVGPEGSTATISVWDRRGNRLGTVYLGPMPAAGQGTLTAQLSALLRDI